MKILSSPSPNFDERPTDTPIDMLVLHYTGMKSAQDALDRMCDSKAEVSAHYMIDEDGNIIQLVAEDKRAWHAGVAYWRGHTNINARSIGIEIVNPGHEWGYRAFPHSKSKPSYICPKTY
ncbi:N-acetylmuramoyl-L-alanine amidase [Terasakiella sp.]|uniref:N-acetylmuramoyl-L-alanine amidase n=1 Tax=Terasakiella sp. TaxID=2034861 RepID=UPI003B004980